MIAAERSSGLTFVDIAWLLMLGSSDRAWSARPAESMAGRAGEEAAARTRLEHVLPFALR